MSESLVTGHDLHRSYGARNVLNGVSVSISRGDRIGLVGDNGSGKSTLCRVICGLEEADTGTMMRKRELRIEYLSQEPRFEPGATAIAAALSGLSEWSKLKRRYDQASERLASGAEQAAEVIAEQAALSAELERLGGWDLEHRALSFLQKLKVPDPNTAVETMSGGEQRRVALARLLIAEPDLLVLDEPTNHLDTDCIDWLEQLLLEGHYGALLLITHDRYFLDRVVQTTWEIANGKLSSYVGGYEAFLEAKAERLALQARTEANRQNFLRTELSWLRRQPKARGTKQKARTERAEQALEQGAPETRGNLSLNASALRQGSYVVELRGVGLRYGERTLFSGLDLLLGKGQRVGIVGPNGCGKTSLLNVITRRIEPSEGEVVWGKTTQVAYLSQTRSDLDDAASVQENVAGVRQQLTVGGAEITVFSYLERFLFRGEDLRQKVAGLSGGERARVALAKLLLQPANLLVLDEPTNDLDITTMSAVEQMLCDFAGSALIVSHDRYFLDRVATSVLVFEGEGVLTHTVGNYSSYARLRAERLKQEGEVSKAARMSESERAPSAAPEAGKKAPKLTYKEERELAEIEDKIGEAEAEVSRLEQVLADPDLYRERAEEAPGLQQELAVCRTRAAELMDRWQELETKREAYEASRS